MAPRREKLVTCEREAKLVREQRVQRERENLAPGWGLADLWSDGTGKPRNSVTRATKEAKGAKKARKFACLGGMNCAAIGAARPAGARRQAQN